MPWYKYRQNNSGGGFDYNENDGISVNVIVEARHELDADERACEIGLYFDGEGDCFCCGNRWYEAGSHDLVDSSDVPNADDPLVIDESRRLPTTKRADGYETFVHPLDGPFYGAHKETKVINKRTYGGKNGYGVRVWRDTVSEVFAVDDSGYDKSGNQGVPGLNPFQSPCTDIVEFKGGRYEDSRYSDDYYAVWFESKAAAAAFRRKVIEFQDSLPKFNIEEFLGDK